MPRERDSQGRFVSTGAKAATSAQWINSTVRTSERINSYSAVDPEASQFVSQCFGFAQICVMRIAEAASMIPIRLYRPKKKRATDGRAVSKSVKRYLSDGSAGMKAASKFRSDDELEEVVDHPILTILNRPNPYQSGIQFRQAHTLFRKLAGSSYIMPDRKLGFMHLLYPQWVKVIGGKDNLIDRYLYGRSSEYTTSFGADEIWWSKNLPSPFSPFKALAPLQAVLTEQQLYAVINQAELAIFDNCGRPDAVVSFEGHLSDSTAKAIIADLETRHRGAQNAGRMAVVANTKMSIQQLGWAPKDLGNVELQRHVIQSILSAFGVPESEVYMNDANLASARTGNLQYMRQTVMPCAIKDAEEFTTWLVEDEFGLDGWCLAPENAIGVDEEAESMRLIAQVNAGLVTANEARRQLGYDEVEDEIGGVLRVNGQAIAIMDEVARRPPPDPFGGFNGGSNPGVGGNDREDDGSERGDVRPESGDASDERARDGMEHEDAKRLPAPEPEPAVESHTAACGASCTHGRSVKQSELWSKFTDPIDGSDSSVNDTATMRLYRKVEAALLERRDQILAASDEAPHGLDKKMAGLRGTKDATTELVGRLLTAWSVSGESDKFAESVLSMTKAEVKELFDSGVRVGLGQIAKLDETGVLPTLSNDRALAFYSDFKAEYVKRLAAVDETTAASVERAIRDGMAEGESLRAIQGRITSAFEGDGEQSITQARAAMIARTETANATTQGQLGGYADAGVEEYEFSLAPNPCEFCEAVSKQYSGVGVKIGTPLYKQGDTLTGADGGTMVMDYGDTYVPIHPNCRCEIRPRVKR